MLASQWHGTAIYVTLGMTVKQFRRAMRIFVGLFGNHVLSRKQLNQGR